MTRQFRVGEFRCVAVSDGALAYPPPVLLANTRDEVRSKELLELGEDPEQIILPYTCLYVDTGRNKMLFDTGIGQGIGPDAGKLLESLGEAGVRPTEIDTVVLSHGHPDHIGGLTKEDGTLSFPNARHVFWGTEWNYWTSESSLNSIPAGPFRELLVSFPRKNLPPIKPNLDLIDKAGEVAPGVEVIPTPGHTVGHISFGITSGNDRLLVIVDVAVHRLQLTHPDWVTSVEFCPRTATATRRSLLDQAAVDKVRVMAYHLPFPGLGRIAANGSAWHWEPDAGMGTAR